MDGYKYIYIYIYIYTESPAICTTMLARSRSPIISQSNSVSISVCSLSILHHIVLLVDYLMERSWRSHVCVEFQVCFSCTPIVFVVHTNTQ